MTECVASLLSLWNGLFGLFRSLYRSRFHPSKRSGIHKEHFMWSLIGVVHWDSFQCPVFCNRCRNWCVLWSVFSLFALSMGILYLKLRRGTDLSNKFRPHTTFHHRRRKKNKATFRFFRQRFQKSSSLMGRHFWRERIKWVSASKGLATWIRLVGS